MNVKIKDINGEEKEQEVQAITISQATTPATATSIQDLTNEVQHLRDEIVELKQTSTIPENTNVTPTKENVATQAVQSEQVVQQPEALRTEVQNTRQSENASTFLTILFGVVTSIIVFISKILFYILNILFTFIKNVLDMLLDILIAVDFTGIIADLTDRKDKV